MKRNIPWRHLYWRHLYWLGIVITAGAINACISITPTPQTPPQTPPQTSESAEQLWRQQQALNASIQTWSVSGKIGVKSGSSGGSATLNWDYQTDNQHIELYGPFGSGRVQIAASNSGAILKDTKGGEIKGQTAAEVLHKRLGWHIPFDQLVYWCRGLAGENATDIRIDERGRLKSLHQGIWSLQYQEYQSIHSRILPRKLTLTSLPGNLQIYDDDGNYLGDQLSVKIILKRWQTINGE